jgi:ketosteroid isomerase-like protein
MICRNLARRGMKVLPAAAMFLALAAWAIPLHAGMLLAPKHENHHVIDRLEEQWCDAVLTANLKEMDTLLSSDYIAITTSGTLQTKAEALEDMRSGRVHFTSINVTDRKVRFYGNTAVVTSLAEMEATTPDGPITGTFRSTRVYVRNPQGYWKIVSFEANRVHESGSHKKNESH